MQTASFLVAWKSAQRYAVSVRGWLIAEGNHTPVQVSRIDKEKVAVTVLTEPPVMVWEWTRTQGSAPFNLVMAIELVEAVNQQESQ